MVDAKTDLSTLYIYSWLSAQPTADTGNKQQHLPFAIRQRALLRSFAVEKIQDVHKRKPMCPKPTAMTFPIKLMLHFRR